MESQFRCMIQLNLVVHSRINICKRICRFQDDDSDKIVNSNDVKKVFSNIFNVASKKDFDRWFTNHFEQVRMWSQFQKCAIS